MGKDWSRRDFSWRLYTGLHLAGLKKETSETPLPDPVQIGNTFVTWSSDVKYLGVLDPTLLYTKHIRTVTSRATGTLCNIFPLLTRHSTLSQTSKLTLNKLLTRSLLTYAAPVYNTTWFNLPQTPKSSKRRAYVWSVTISGLFPSPICTTSLISNPSETSSTNLRPNFFAKCPSHPKPLVQQIGNYTLDDLNSLYTTYKHKRPKHILL
jgi:hypothetical protein